VKHLLAFFLAALSLFASAQTVPGTVVLTWTNPTTSIDGVPLTGANALTGIEVHWSTSPIADTDLSRVAQVTLSGTAQTTTQTIQVTNGQTLYFRVRAVRGAEKSGFSNQASKLVQLSTVPSVPTSLTVTITIAP
jgi:predicted phage tail protein